MSKGFTLVELLIALLLFSILTTLGYQSLAFLQHASTFSFEGSSQSIQTQQAINFLVRDLQNSLLPQKVTIKDQNTNELDMAGIYNSSSVSLVGKYMLAEQTLYRLERNNGSKKKLIDATKSLSIKNLKLIDDYTQESISTLHIKLVNEDINSVTRIISVIKSKEVFAGIKEKSFSISLTGNLLNANSNPSLPGNGVINDQNLPDGEPLINLNW